MEMKMEMEMKMKNGNENRHLSKNGTKKRLFLLCILTSFCLLVNPKASVWCIHVTSIQTNFNSQCVFHFFGVTREKELFLNGRFSGCNLMRQSSNQKLDQYIRNIYLFSHLVFYLFKKQWKYVKQITKRCMKNFTEDKWIAILATKSWNVTNEEDCRPLNRLLKRYHLKKFLTT